MANNVLTIPENVYTTIQNYVIDTYREKYPSGLIPVENIGGEPYTYRIPTFSDVDVSKGVLDWDAEQARADKILNYLDVPIFGRQMKIAYSARDLRAQGADIIDAKKQAIMTKFLDEVDYAIWHGNKEGDVTLSSGILAQATSVVDLDGTDSALVGAAGLLAALKKMVTSMPVKYRTNAPIVLISDWHFYDHCATTFLGTDTATSVAASFKAAYPNVYWFQTNNILDSADTAGTNYRLFAFAQDPNILRRVVAKEVSPVGPAIMDLTGSVEQLWGTLFAVKAVDATGVLYSEQITYSAT